MVELNKRNDHPSGQAAAGQTPVDQLVDGHREVLAATALLQRRKVRGPAPLSFAQERLWFLEQINPADRSANLSRAFRITGALDISALKRSLQLVVTRHESLRTT